MKLISLIMSIQNYNVENDFDLANDFCKMILKKGEEYGFKIR